MKHIKLFEQFVNEVSKDENIKKMQALKSEKSIIDIWDETDLEDDESEMISNFIKNLEKHDYQVFTKDLKKFKPQDGDTIIGPEGDPSDIIYTFEDGLVTGTDEDMSWKEYYKENGPDAGYGENSIIVVRKINKSINESHINPADEHEFRKFITDKFGIKPFHIENFLFIDTKGKSRKNELFAMWKNSDSKDKLENYIRTVIIPASSTLKKDLASHLDKNKKIQETASWIADKWDNIISTFKLSDEETKNVVKAFDRMDYDSKDAEEVRNAMSDALDEAGITFSYDKLTQLINGWGLDKMRN